MEKVKFDWKKVTRTELAEYVRDNCNDELKHKFKEEVIFDKKVGAKTKKDISRSKALQFFDKEIKEVEFINKPDPKKRRTSLVEMMADW